MELWIRSQDKETLTKVEVLVREDNMIVDYYQKRIVLGKYKTKERALEVLEEIQELLKPNYIRTYEYKGYDEQPSITVYEMPKE